MGIRQLSLSLFLFLFSIEILAIEAAQDSEILKSLNYKISKTIQYAPSIPGLDDEESASIREKIGNLFETLANEGTLVLEGSDKDIRPYFVGLQAIIEHVLASSLNKEVSSLKGFIHTPLPPTPLCTTGEISSNLVATSVANDPSSLFTVLARSMIVRNYLLKGGYLYAIYPGNGFKKRSSEQQSIYIQELINHPNHLFDVPLKCDHIPPEFIGATYLFNDDLGEIFVFHINFTQANDPQSFGKFSLCYGSINRQEIQKRISDIALFLDEQGFTLMKEASEK